MSEWISKAANVFKRDVSETPQPFEIYCECGQKHSGIRRVRSQHIICKACGVALFILPHDTYPPPHTPKKSTKKRKKRAKTTTAAATPIDLSPEILISRGVPSGETDETTRSHKSGSQGEHEEVFIEERSNILVRFWIFIWSWIVGFAIAFKQFWTPYRQLAVVIVALLALTAFFSIRQSGLREAGILAKQELADGLDDLNQKKWVEAREHFQQAATAVDRLKRTDLEANSIRQYLRETTALTRLTSYSLIEFVERAEEYYVAQGPDAWQEKFRQKYRDDWYIIEGYLRPISNPVGHAAGYELELDFPIVVGARRRGVSVQLDFDLAVNLPSVSSDQKYDSEEGALAVFAAKINNCVIETDGKWHVRMDPHTSFFWSNQSTYEATHLNIGSILPPDKLTELLKLQEHWMGVR